MNKSFFQRTLLILFASILLLLAGYCGLQVSRISNQRAEIKKDYSVLNNITFGLLSVNAWRDHLIRIVTNRIDDFELSAEQDKALKFEVAQVLNAVINRADKMLDKKQKHIGGKLKKFVIRTFVNEDKLRAQVPVFANTIVEELKKPNNRTKLKFLVQSKLEDFGTITYDSTNDILRSKSILAKYQEADATSFNQHSELLLTNLQTRTYNYTFIILGIIFLFLCMWWVLRKQTVLHTPLFVMSVLLSLMVLFVGLTSPMIEIDARIHQMSFLLLGEKISFHDQVLFYQSKSIVDVVQVLIETRKVDSVVVGLLILIFSILFPVGKMLSTKLYLLGNDRWRHNQIIQFFAFKSGKWSMADVNVVAIFMAYIGFKGIMDSQLEGLNMQTASLASISTNDTSLQPGFMLFTAFVLFGLVLSSILHWITLDIKKEKTMVSTRILPIPVELGAEVKSKSHLN